MPGVDFLDTNVFVYAYDPADSRKQSIAQELVRAAVRGESVASTQVLAELATTLLHKAPARPPAEKVLELLDALDPITLVLPDAALVHRAVEAHGRYGVHFYDGMIIAAAERAGCARLLTEDLNAGQDYFGVVAHDPFA